MEENLKKIYVPLIKKGIKVDGIAAETVLDGETGTIIQKSFINSTQENFEKYVNNIISFVVGPNQGDSINKLLVIIGKDNVAKVYSEFPVLSKVNAKVNVNKGMLISKKHILDIDTIEFSDGKQSIYIKEGDKLIWLFRHDWKFGLYFDFSGKLKPTTLFKELGACYRSLLFYNLYSFLENKNNFDKMLQDGWFPFIQLTDENFEKLSQYYLEDSKYNFYIYNILKEFSEERINSITKYWWYNQIFNSKKPIIEAGISAYLQDNEQGFINCIKTLFSEVEGIIRIACFNDTGTAKLTFEDLKDHITNKGLSKFASTGSLAFPKLFYDYLTEVVFKGFDMGDETMATSRHSVGHGVAKCENYNKIKAFQLILILDQIYFFLGKS